MCTGTGTSLVRLGKAHVQLASLQSTFANDFRTQWLAACHRFGEDIRDFEHQKKKLESRRSVYFPPHDRYVTYDERCYKVELLSRDG